MSARPNESLDGATHELQEVRLSADEVAILERNLRLTPEQRLDQLVRAVRFIEEGRAAVKRARG